MKAKPYSKADFTWVNWKKADIDKYIKTAIENKKSHVQKIKSVPRNQRTYENTIFPFENLSQTYDVHMGGLDILFNLSPDEKVRQAAYSALVEFQKSSIEIDRDKELYSAIKEFKPKKNRLQPHEWKYYNDLLRIFRRMGLDLPEKKQKQLKLNLKKLAEMESAFGKNISDYRDEIIVLRKDLEGLSEQYIASLPNAGKAKFKVTLDYPIMGPFMSHAKSEEKRRALAEKISQRGGSKNLALLGQIVALRHANAQLLGYKHHADYVLENRMAKNSQTVFNFLNTLRSQVQKASDADLNKLKDRKKTDSKTPFAPYDGTYYAERLFEEEFNIRSEELREYFSLDYTLQKTFDLFQKLLDIRISKWQIKLWHKDVMAYQIHDGKGDLVGYFALDLFPRPGKFSHQAVDNTYHGHLDNSNNYNPGFSVMMGNFPRASKTHPSLLSHDEVTTFLHECGHLIHGSITKTKYVNQSGTRVKWDFVELPSQLFENWIWTKEVLKDFNKHYETGKKLPDEIIDRLIKSKMHLISRTVTRQIALGLFDMTIHTQKPGKNLKKIYDEYMSKIFGVPPMKVSVQPAGFGHMAGYDAGYYSYLWALVYAADVFGEFKKKGILNTELGVKYKKEILEVGSSRDEMESLTKFLGRKPNNKAFLKSLGIK